MIYKILNGKQIQNSVRNDTCYQFVCIQDTIIFFLLSFLYMYAVISDNLGRIRIINIWTNNVVHAIGGNEHGAADKLWSIGDLLLESNQICVSIHDSGYASFYEFTENRSSEGSPTRTKIIKVGNPGKSYSLKKINEGYYTSCFNGYISVFSNIEVKESSIFETISDSSCGSSFGKTAAFGRLQGHCTAYDVIAQKQIWEAADPPLDELKLPLRDFDHSLEFIDENLFIVGQTEGKILLYDIRSGPEAIFRSSNILPEFPIVTIKMIDENQFIVGDTTGLNRICDIRTDTNTIEGTKAFVGLTGTITGFAKHPSLPLVAAISCDRTCHLFDSSKFDRAAIKVSYTKTLPTAIALFDDEMPNDDPDEAEWNMLEEDTTNVWANYQPGVQTKIALKE